MLIPFQVGEGSREPCGSMLRTENHPVNQRSRGKCRGTASRLCRRNKGPGTGRETGPRKTARVANPAYEYVGGCGLGAVGGIKSEKRANPIEKSSLEENALSKALGKLRQRGADEQHWEKKGVTR